MHIKIDIFIYSIRSKLALKTYYGHSPGDTFTFIAKIFTSNLIKILGLKSTWALLTIMLVGFAVSESQ